MVHYQSGEDIVVILCHHPHGLGLHTQTKMMGSKGVKEGKGMENALLLNQQMIQQPCIHECNTLSVLLGCCAIRVVQNDIKSPVFSAFQGI